MLKITEIVGIIKKWRLSIREEIENMFKMMCRHDISVDFIHYTPIRKYGWKKRDKIINIQYWIMGINMSAMIGTSTRSQRKRCRCFALAIVNMDVISSWLCRFVFTIFYQRRGGGVSRLILMWFGQTFRWGRRKTIWWIIQNMIHWTSIIRVFEDL